MTISSAMTPANTIAADIVSDLGGSSSTDVSMMIGIGLVKDSDAVFFQYLGSEGDSAALMLPSGKPCNNMNNVTLAGLSIADDIGEFKSTKLNVFLTTSAGRTIMLTSGLTTIWSQCLITSLMGLFNSYDLNSPFSISSWKGTSKMRPCFASIYLGRTKVSDPHMYQQLADLRADGAKDKVTATMRDAVEILNQAVTGGAVEPAVVSVDDNTTDLF